ncbi:MAG: hypothetical protein A2X56_13990 [Nitrospirae bacterium GWC2_57_13]|nr:MAG: hypothetical protein A2X56_13990 [Nitrospirae bacterium GWC2_57_13]HAR44634.1 hypothetical protein [Nitrospiraceae bacterium]HAS55623.1 hypothetical protein [Nitrospiraceae bacterium]
MDQDDIKKYSAEFVTMLTHATAALTTIQGLEVGFFDNLSPETPVSAEELSGHLGYDITRVSRWLRFGIAGGYVAAKEGGFVLTPKGALLRKDTPAPDLLGIHNMVSYFTTAIQRSRDVYQKGMGLDSITKGKISRDYIPRVASQLSRASAGFFKWSGLSGGHTILDLGCGDGSVLRETVKSCPGVSATGVDINPHTIELGSRKNREAGLQDQIELQQGDVTNLERFKDSAYDWVYAVNLFHFLPVKKRETFLREMIRISRFGVFFNQVMTNTLGTHAVDVLLSTLFSDYTGFFTLADADVLIQEVGIKYYASLPIILGESRLIAMYTSTTDMPIGRLSILNPSNRSFLAQHGITTAKELLTADAAMLAGAGIAVDDVRRSAIQLLFP